jgi:DNA-binding NarL/FixJ family response regulator
VIRVLVCDQSALFRRHLILALEHAPDIEVVGEAPDADVARSAALQKAPDVAVLGGHLPPIGGVRTAAALRESNPGIGLALVYDPDDEREERELRRALRVGVTGVLARGSADETVVSVARAVAAGRPVIDAFAAQALLAEHDWPTSPADAAPLPPPPLDAREQQVLEQLAAGWSTADTAGRLGLPVTTTTNLVTNALRKLQRWARTTERARRAEAQTAGS